MSGMSALVEIVFMVDDLEGEGFEIRGGEHAFMEVDALYIDDPDGNDVEIVTMRGAPPA